MVPVADPTPASLRRRSGRQARPLPEGPYPVPVSTLDWLLSRESFAARYVTLRDLLDRPPKDPELRRAIREFPRDQFVRDLLPLLSKRLAPGGTPEDLERRYDGGLWQTLLLTEIGGGQTLPEIRRAGPVLLARWEKSFIAIDRGERLSGDPGLFSFACRTLARIGFASDPRVGAAADYFARRRMTAERHALPASKDLLLFLSIPEAVRTEAVRQAISLAAESAVLHDLLPPGIPPPFAFPAFDLPDMLESLEALAAAGAEKRPPVRAALAAVAARADHRARWKLERAPAAPMLVELGTVGEPSRWVTLRALRVLQHFQGLTTSGAARGA